MNSDELDNWDLADRDHRTPGITETLYCRSSEHGDEVEMQRGEDGVFTCGECGARVRVE